MDGGIAQKWKWQCSRSQQRTRRLLSSTPGKNRNHNNNDNNLAATRQAPPPFGTFETGRLGVVDGHPELPNKQPEWFLSHLADPHPRRPLPEIAELSNTWPIPRGAIQRPRLVRTRTTHPTRRQNMKVGKRQTTSEYATRLRRYSVSFYLVFLSYLFLSHHPPPPSSTKLTSFPSKPARTSVRITIDPA